MIRAQEIMRMKETLTNLYVRHAGCTREMAGKGRDGLFLLRTSNNVYVSGVRNPVPVNAQSESQSHDFRDDEAIQMNRTLKTLCHTFMFVRLSVIYWF